MSSKPKRPQHVFVVDRSERLSPHMVRVHLGGPAFDGFVAAADPERLDATDKYVKLLLAKPSLGLTPPYDLEALRETLPKDDRPARRTYTVRSVDHTAKTIAVDFVVHGDDGLAGPWAASAQPGDLLALSGPGGGYSPSTDPAVTHVLLGDDSSLPAISAALEAMPDSATGVALVEVAGPDDELPVRHPAGVDLRWLHRDAAGAEPGTLLLETARQLPRASRPVQVFAHGERTAMKAIRRLLQDDWGLEKSDMSLSAYWALGRAEDRFQEEKREPIGVIFTE
ncbi:NADPH-dependent ferric siderophore reductase, contains FAD-binding and SIP domains [Curtobacterium sp. UNCCL20]|uniref:siderophore-interacting protein n=1 Tax=Curtobacterium sp. UNCCL20 TaxID=1502773 RepID=UPI0008905357|nr:siderophore-interacting protein [Curtobacterium sp. UNCCL20]SDR02159.1 NADPH-dependent ferric siderophore reductase, contains FAD-binding and SIP domains [Curtobacterium sp. UNCCL20]